MSRFSTPRLLGQGFLRILTTKPQCTAPSAPQWTRLFSQSRVVRVEEKEETPMESMRGIFASATGNPISNFDGSDLVNPELAKEEKDDPLEPYHFHIYSHRHNTHVTVSDPQRNALISLSCGNLGFKNSGRKQYDAAYQLGAYVIDKMNQKGLTKKIHKLEVILRGFGAGREAVVKVLMGNEGKVIRNLITRVSDATRLKFGGTRSKRPRRLG
ncbi:hypothetical protein QBC35DRAFT_108043 [Podospora australis]|uniref:Small ribosomal subunit protein uS11m n=1 Tax=Podospora australis TaxID=1536484 RepID=A0AAN6X5M5_9PEZI|nr:hypothetical protein QBC35DRAFT_108043 [Podospora australis]